MTLWQSRLSSPPADELLGFTESLSFDQQLGAYDILGSKAHVRGLVHAKLLSEEEGQRLLDALDAVREELQAGTFAFQPSDEDIHTAVERRVTELIGDVGAKLHSGRSRNDQIALDMRLYAREAVAELASRLLTLIGVLTDMAEGAADAIMPGYTHTQRAQPVPVAHYLLAHAWALHRDLERLVATYGRMDVSPLGAGALAGTTLPLDPGFVAAELGFAGTFANSLDAVSRRDFWSRSSLTSPCWGCTSRGCPRRSCSSRPRSSALRAWITPMPLARRCCRRRRTPTSPSAHGQRAAGTSAT